MEAKTKEDYAKKYGLAWCPTCEHVIEIIYVFPDKAVMLKCDHELSEEELKKYRRYSV